VAKAILKERQNGIFPSRADFPIVLQGMKDLQELHVITTVLSPAPEKKQIWRTMRKIFGDTALPSKSSGKSGARNYQFELFSLAILERAGLSPQPQDEGADFLCTLGNQRIAIEAKRVSSLDRLYERSHEAGKQIRETDSPGFIFMDYSEAVNPGDKTFVFATPVEGIGSIQEKRFRHFIRMHEAGLHNAIQGCKVIGFVFFDHLIIQQGKKGDDGLAKWECLTIRDHYQTPARFVADKRLAETMFELLTHLGLPITG
jgi:hypothetical protein